jgi:hypothetical protein
VAVEKELADEPWEIRLGNLCSTESAVLTACLNVLYPDHCGSFLRCRFQYPIPNILNQIFEHLISSSKAFIHTGSMLIYFSSFFTSRQHLQLPFLSRARNYFIKMYLREVVRICLKNNLSVPGAGSLPLES